MLNIEEISLLKNISNGPLGVNFGENKKIECDPQNFKHNILLVLMINSSVFAYFAFTPNNLRDK